MEHHAVKLSDLALDISSKEEVRIDPVETPTPSQTSTPLAKAPPIPANPGKVRQTLSESTADTGSAQSNNITLLGDSFKRPLSPKITGEPRPMTPLITGGSLMGEINWSNSQNAKGAPIASVESLSPTCTYILIATKYQV